MTRTVALALCAGACALACIGPAPPPLVRFYRPVPIEAEAAAAPAATFALQLRRVTAAPHLSESMALRLSATEYAFDELHRWIATPAALVEEALQRELFVRAGFRRADSGAEVLSVHVAAFEHHAGQAEIALLVTLSAEGAANAENAARTWELHASHPLSGEGPQALAQAMGRALQDVAAQVTRLGRR